ncbi:GNAT family N-acetyltransferase [Mycobacterium sp. MYCO198283]|uniref:GNAT family N-acetyltransferase n=1 Tax=Mycobacterium sp. MYCO198283 TaxID=2883505 RepID=UPI001E2852D9|nr:GNAT family N-acetyltransferase [Mycobacterium sp. MYCO198283]MCG5432509.1 GNAT family N-acetyltransferase [Mycobacterium sp. MYCO198283]
MAEIAVRPAARADLRALSQVLGRAFFDDPVMRWMMPDDRARAARLPRVFATMTRHHYLGNGGVEVASGPAGIGAAALWDPPNKWQQTDWQGLRMLPTFLFAMRSRVRRGQLLTETTKKVHPEEPHWYLGVIGSDPTVRGGGYGQALMRSRLDRCDAEGAPAYLESSKPDNVPYYERFGFTVTREIALPEDGPLLWAMWRQPRTG